jgi:hypothetical protein
MRQQHAAPKRQAQTARSGSRSARKSGRAVN